MHFKWSCKYLCSHNSTSRKLGNGWLKGDLISLDKLAVVSKQNKWIKVETNTEFKDFFSGFLNF